MTRHPGDISAQVALWALTRGWLYVRCGDCGCNELKMGRCAKCRSTNTKLVWFFS